MKPAFNVKSARLDALAVQLHGTDPEAVRETLQNNIEKYAKFKSLPFVLDISRIESFQDLPLGDIVMTFAFFGLNITAVRHHNPEAAAWAAKFRLCFVPPQKNEAEENAESAPATDSVLPENNTSDPAEDDVLRNDNEAVKTVEMAKAADLVELGGDAAAEEDAVSGVLDGDGEAGAEEKVSLMAAKPTIVVSQPVRTGQQIYAEQADLIVLGTVSAGAEVIADGNIHIYAPLFGRALAGAAGDEKARIFVQSMQAELVSIAGIYRVFEQQLPPHLHKKAVKIELQDERLAIGALYSE